ncbi:hypothetical protein Dimus_003954 [Dionaea muscipula]
MEYLTRRLRKMSTMPGFKFRPKCRRMGIFSLCFADDLMVEGSVCLFLHDAEGCLFCMVEGCVCLFLHVAEDCLFYTLIRCVAVLCTAVHVLEERFVLRAAGK